MTSNYLLMTARNYGKALTSGQFDREIGKCRSGRDFDRKGWALTSKALRMLGATDADMDACKDAWRLGFWA